MSEASSNGGAGKWQRGHLLLVAGVLAVVGSAIFNDYLFGPKLLLYKDIGADSLNDTYPTFVYLSDYLRTRGLPTWSFSAGMGQNIYQLVGNLILEPVVWLSRQMIAGALVYQHLLKTLLVGLIFFRFLRLRQVDLCGSLGGALALAFSTHMLMGSCWMINAEETVCLSFVLLAAEEALTRGRWLYLPVAVAASGLITIFHLYLAALLLCVHVPFRLLERWRWEWRLFARTCQRLSGLALLGVGLGAVVFFSNLELILHTARGSGKIANWAFDPAPAPWEPASPLYYLTALTRFFSADFLGTGDAFRGWENYYEAPQSYCGLLCLLLFPQIFVATNTRRRLLSAGLLGLFALPVILPWFRYAFWLFQGGYFRAFSLLSIFVLLSMSATVLSRYRQRRTFNLWLLVATLLVLLTILLGAVYRCPGLTNRSVAGTAMAYLAGYAAILIAGRLSNRERLAAWLVVLVTAIELIHFNRITLDRPTVTKAELTQRVGYNDETVDVMRDLKSSDHDFFRVTKTWASGPANVVSYNDALVFGYYGTLSYSSYNNLDYIQFLIALGAIPPDDIPTDAQSSPGLLGQPLLSAFACEKYVVTKEPVRFEMAGQYELVRRYGSIYLFRNKKFLPFGVIYDQWLPERAFLEMPDWAKAEALLHVVTLSDENDAARAALSQMTLGQLKENLRAIPVPDALERRREHAFVLQSFDERHLNGRARSERRSLLLFQMPFDRGWRVSVDDRPCAIARVDCGLLGLVLDAGEHSVALHYQPPFLFLGAFTSIFSLLIFLLRARRWPRFVIARKL